MRLASSALALILMSGVAACGGQTPAATTSETEASAIEITQADRDAETERLNAFFETKFNESLSRNPMSATFLGSRENYDKWNDASDANRIAEMEIQRQTVAEMRELFDVDALSDQGRLSYRLAEYQLELAEKAHNWRFHIYSFSQMRGAHEGLPGRRVYAAGHGRGRPRIAA